MIGCDPLDPVSKEIRQANYDILRSIILQKLGCRPATEDDLRKIEHLVNLSFVETLKSPTLYTTGQRRLSERQIVQISDQFETIKTRIGEKIQQRENYLAETAHILMAMISRLREHPIHLKDSESMQKLLADYYQIMSHTVAYGRWKKGDEILGPHSGLPNYCVHEVVRNSKGLQIIVLTPQEKRADGLSLPPIFCCRGTMPANPHNLIDDLNRHIGDYSLHDAEPKIEELLKTVSEEYGPAVIAGHSLGGAIAQAITAHYCGQANGEGLPFIRSTYVYNAPGIGEEMAEQYNVKLQSLPPEQQPEIFEYYHYGDIVFLAGGAHLKTNHIYQTGDRFSLSPQAIKNAHAFSYKLLSEMNMVHFDVLPLRRRVARFLAEEVRSVASKIVTPFLFSNIHHQEHQRALVKELVEFLKHEPLFSEDEELMTYLQENHAEILEYALVKS